jgi:DNA-binding NtrC family response regulator
LQKSFLLITADESLAGFLKESLEPSGFAFEWRKGPPARARELSLGARPIVLDLTLQNSLKSIVELRAYHPDARIIAVSNGDPGKAEESLKLGASFILPERGTPPPVLREIFRRAYSEMAVRDELESLRALSEQKIIARSPRMKRLMKHAGDAAGRREPAMLFGEPGAGRELVARHIHLKGAGAGMPFVKVVGEDGLANAVAAARGGTLFVKEIAVLGRESMDGLRALISRGFFPVDGTGIIADVRVMAGCLSHEDAFPLMDTPFVALEVPPLRERREDIVPLAECFIEEIARHLKKAGKHLTKKARESLAGRDFEKGNAAELKDLVQRAYFFGGGAGISEKDLFGSEHSGRCSVKSFLDEKLRGYMRKMSSIENSNLYDTVISEVEKSLIELALSEMKGNKVRAARALGMNRNTFRAKMKQLRIKEFKAGNP